MSNENESGQQNLVPTLDQAIEDSKDKTWLMMDSLKAGDRLDIFTWDHIYYMQIVDPKSKQVILKSNSPMLPRDEYAAWVNGTSLSGRGTMVKMGGITCGLCLVLTIKGIGEVILSATQEVRINDSIVLPVNPALTSSLN